MLTHLLPWALAVRVHNYWNPDNLKQLENKSSTKLLTVYNILVSFFCLLSKYALARFCNTVLFYALASLLLHLTKFLGLKWLISPSPPHPLLDMAVLETRDPKSSFLRLTSAC